MISLNNDSLDVDKCAYCKYRLVVPIGMTIIEITTFNQKVAKEQLHKMKIWSNLPTKKRGVKPRPGKSLSQHLVCMCVKMNCLDKANGSGYVKCDFFVPTR